MVVSNIFYFHPNWILFPLRLHGMSWGVKTTCFKAPGVSLGGFGVSIEGVRILRVKYFLVTNSYIFPWVVGGWLMLLPPPT